MVDIHQHLLYGLDDGARDEEMSIAMAELAAKDGITHVVCTPHANERYRYDRERNEDRRQALQERLVQESIPLTLGLGCDFHLSYQNVKDAIEDPRRFTINATQYLLVELPDYGIPPNITDVFLQLQAVGIQLILTHPERNMTLAAEPARMLEWLEDGMLLQVTADSVTGKMGRAAHDAAHRLLARGLVHFLASDGHNMLSRPPQMGSARDIVARHYGVDYAYALCQLNPQAVFVGKPINMQRLTRSEGELPPVKSWLRRVFRA